MDTKQKNAVVKELAEILSRETKIDFAYLHGSFLESGGFNDIDIAVYLKDGIPQTADPADYEIRLSLKVGKTVKIPVDIKILNNAPLGFRYQASKGKVLFSRNGSDRDEFLCRTWLEYFDFMPFAELYLKEAISG
jgi:predicted nucleotidyltransferase